MKPRAVVIDILGDYLRYRGGRTRLRDLTALLRTFDITEPTARAALARWRRDGWFSTEPRDKGRGVEYVFTKKS